MRVTDNHSTALRLSDIFSEDELVSLNQAVNRHLAALSFIRDNCTREQAGQQIAYAMDFQELYAYVHPYDKDSEHSVMAAYILNNCSRPILIPPGTVQELLNYLEGTCQRLAGINSLSTILKDDPDTASLVARIQTIPESEKALSECFDELVLSDTKKLSLTLVARLAMYERELEALHQVLKQDNIKGIGDLVDLSTFSAAEKAGFLEKYRRAYRLLNAERPDRTLSNTADAANVALTFLVRNYRRPSGGISPYCVYLVTHTPTLMLINFRTWGTDVLGQRYGLESRILAQPEDVLYATIVEGKFDTCATRLAFANSATSTCSRILARLPPLLPAPSRRRLRTRVTYVEDLRRLQDMKAQALNQYLADFYDYVNRDLLAPLHEYEEQWSLDSQFEANKRLALGDVAALQSHEVISASTDRIKSKISAIQRICRKKLLDDGLGLEEVVVNPAEQARVFAPSLFALLEHEEPIADLNSNRYYLTREPHGPNDVVLGIDEYPGYYCCFWRTSQPFAKLPPVLNRILKRLRQRGIGQVQSGEQRAPSRRDVYIQGLLAFTLQRRHELALEIPLDIEKLIAPLADEGLQSIRVNTLVGDFFVDVLPEQVGEDTYVGVASHADLEEPIFELFYETSRFYVWPTTLKDILHKRLSKYKPRGGIRH